MRNAFSKLRGLRKHRHPCLSGFTLIELMITVVIVGIIIAFAYPSYKNYMTQTRRSDAHIALAFAANQQERFFTECNHYAQNLAGANRACGTAGADFSNGVLKLYGNGVNPVLSPDRHYAITLVDPTPECRITTCYVLQATPAEKAQGGTGQQVGDGNFRLSSIGEKRWAKDGTNYNHKWTDK